MSDLIDRQDAIDTVTRYCNQYDLRELLADIEVLPSAEAVLKGTYEQVRWERDTALEQLKELGYSLGEKPRKGDLISREELQMQLNCVDRLQMTIDGRTIEVIPRWNVNKIIENLPTAERVGHWIEGQTAGQRFVKCSRCGHIEFDGTPNYCEDCGARMVSEDDT